MEQHPGMPDAALSIFISYRHDAPWTALSKKLAVKLRAALPPGGELFHDTRIAAGDEWKKEVDAALQRCTHFVALLSDEYWVLSAECRRELQVAVQRRQHGGVPKLLFVQAGSIRPERMRLDGASQGQLQGEAVGLEHLGQINFLGPHDAHGHLVTLATERRRLDLQLAQLRDRLLAA